MTVDINVENIGPVEEFSASLGDPGLYTLRGDHGSGKTTIIRTVQLAVDGRTDINPTKRDGSKMGKATVAGKTIKVSRTTRKEGELCVEGLGEIDLSTLHSPHFKDAKKRDEYRIRALATLAGVDCSVDMFHGLLGGQEEFESVVDPELTMPSDIVEMASFVKRTIDKQARSYEELQGKHGDVVRAGEMHLDGIDLTAEDDEAVLNQRLESAISCKSTLEEKAKAAEKASADANIAKSKLAEFASTNSLDDVRKNAEESLLEVAHQKEVVAELESQLEQAKLELQRRENAAQLAKSQLENVQSQLKLCDLWKETIEKAENIERPSTEDLELADKEVENAREAVRLGIVVRNAKSTQTQLAEAREQMLHYEKKAVALRKASSKVLEVVSDAIGRIENCPMSVRYDDDGNARLVTKTDRSDHEPIDELSDGERWKLILPLAFQPNRLLTISQAAFGELSEETKSYIHEQAVKSGCFVLAPQISNGQLRCERFEPGFALQSS